MQVKGELIKAPQPTRQRLEEYKREQEQLQDIQLLLENLFEREEATAKIILGCLYDIGYVNLINQKVPTRVLRQVLKSVARMSKPAFKVVALHWFKKNCPRLITEYLHSLVNFSS